MHQVQRRQVEVELMAEMRGGSSGKVSPPLSPDLPRWDVNPGSGMRSRSRTAVIVAPLPAIEAEREQ